MVKCQSSNEIKIQIQKFIKKNESFDITSFGHSFDICLPAAGRDFGIWH